MKKSLIVLLMAFIVVPMATMFNVEAATYEENNDQHSYERNDLYTTAEYIDSDYFERDECYMTSHSYPCYSAQIEGYIDSGGSGGKDHYSFYIPYDTNLRITNSLEYSNGEYIYGIADYKLYRVDESFNYGETYDNRMGESSVIDLNGITVNEGVPVKAGYYVISYDHKDNDDTISRQVTGWFGIKYNKTYVVKEYHFSVSYLPESSDYVDTSKSIYESKLDNDSAAIWVNDNDYEDLYFTNTGKAYRDELQSDFEDYIGHNMSQTVLDKRIYILSNDMLNFMKDYLENFQELLNFAYDQYEYNVEGGVFGFGHWNTVLGISEGAADDIEFVAGVLKGLGLDALKLGTPVGVLISGVEYLLTNKIQKVFESHQYFLMVYAINQVLDQYPEAELEAHPELFLNFYTVLNDVFGDMIENPEDLPDAVNTIGSLKTAFATMTETVNADQDFLCYFDIMVNYEYDSPELSKLNFVDWTSARLKKNYSFGQFVNSNVDHIDILMGRYDIGDQPFSYELKPDYMLDEEITVNGVTYNGELTYAKLNEDLSDFVWEDENTDPEIKLTVKNDNDYALSGTGDEDLMRFSTSYIYRNHDKLLDGIYAVHSELGFLEVRVEVGPKQTVSSTTVGYVTTRVYRYDITYFVVNPTGGTDKEITDFSGYIQYTYTIDRTPVVIKPGPIQIVGW